MPPRIPVSFASRLSIRARGPSKAPLIGQAHSSVISGLRGFASNSDPGNGGDKKGPNTEQLPHVSEEAAKFAEITGQEGPDLQQGTPIEEVVKDDKEAQKKLPRVIKDSIKASQPKSSRSFSTFTTRRAELESIPSASNLVEPQIPPGFKFDPPTLPLPSYHVRPTKHQPWPVRVRKSPDLVKQFTNLMMRDGKLSKAEKNMATILKHLRTAPAPRIGSNWPLMLGELPASQLPMNPVDYIKVAVDSVAPLLRLKSIRGGAGGGRNLVVPQPISLRRRRRTAIMWIFDSASKRKAKLLKGLDFGERVAEEIVAIVEGRSGAWEKRKALHRQGIVARMNINANRVKSRKVGRA